MDHNTFSYGLWSEHRISRQWSWQYFIHQEIFICLFIYTCVHLCVCVYVRACVADWRIAFWNWLSTSTWEVRSKNRNQAVRLGGKCLYQPSHLTAFERMILGSKTVLKMQWNVQGKQGALVGCGISELALRDLGTVEYSNFCFMSFSWLKLIHSHSSE